MARNWRTKFCASIHNMVCCIAQNFVRHCTKLCAALHKTLCGNRLAFLPQRTPNAQTYIRRMKSVQTVNTRRRYLFLSWLMLILFSPFKESSFDARRLKTTTKTKFYAAALMSSLYFVSFVAMLMSQNLSAIDTTTPPMMAGSTL